MRTIDLNCDMGEGCGNDEQLLDLVSSANVACGFHAGDDLTMRETTKAALARSVTVGAHPGFPDRENFGRTEMDLPHKEIADIVTEQVQHLRSICASLGGRLAHVKPHGAMYNMAARDARLAAIIANAVGAIDPDLVIFGLSGSHLITEAKKAGLKTASEVFADRTYRDDGSLTPRTSPGAHVENIDDAVAQVLQMITSGSVRALSGKVVPIAAETICIHGDGPHAIEFARAINSGLSSEGIVISSIRR